MRAILVGCVLLLGCEGVLSGARSDEPGSPPPAVAGAYTRRFTCGGERGPREQPLRRLDTSEYRNTMQQLFGSVALADGGTLLSQVSLSLPPDEVGREGVVPGADFDSLLVAQVGDIAARLSAALAVDATASQAVGLTRACWSSPTDACLTTFISQWGRLVLRRPLSADDVSDFLTAAHDAGDGAPEKVRAVVMASLLDPEFLFHVEVGVAQRDDAVVLSPHEFASRLSFTVSGAMPDAPLRADADSGRLLEAGVAASHVRRLFGSAGAREHLESWLDTWLPVNPRAGYPQNLPDDYFADAFLGDASNRRARATDLKADVVDFVQAQADATWASVLAAPVAFPRNETARRVYGVSSTEAQVAHHGLLQRPFFLLSPSGNSNPIYRGVFLASKVLCRQLAPPADANLINTVPESDPVTYGTRAQVDRRTGGGACQGCHRQFNPLGFALESFDGLGRARTSERFFVSAPLTSYRLTCDPNDTSVAGHDDPHSVMWCPSTRPPYQHAIDERVSLTIDGEARDITSAAALADALASSQEAAECFSQVSQRFFFKRAATPPEDCAVDDMTNLARSDAPLLHVLFGELLAPEGQLRRVSP